MHLEWYSFFIWGNTDMKALCLYFWELLFATSKPINYVSRSRLQFLQHKHFFFGLLLYLIHKTQRNPRKACTLGQRSKSAIGLNMSVNGCCDSVGAFILISLVLLKVNQASETESLSARLGTVWNKGSTGQRENLRNWLAANQKQKFTSVDALPTVFSQENHAKVQNVRCASCF